MSVADLLGRLPEGYSEVCYRGRRWSVTRTVQQGGRVEKLWAEELGGRDVVSANLYVASTGEQFRPCEMPESVVLEFLTGWTPLPPTNVPAPSPTPRSPTAPRPRASR